MYALTRSLFFTTSLENLYLAAILKKEKNYGPMVTSLSVGMGTKTACNDENNDAVGKKVAVVIPGLVIL
jgi:hypothetical protein